MLGIIMAGGQGTRLMPLTATRPKPMVEVLGRPVIDFVKDSMVEAGINHIVVTTGYKGDQLEAHVSTWCEHNGLQARVNQEATPMGTAGSVGLLREAITSTCVVGSGDAIASFDIKALLEAHRANDAKVTMALWQVDDPTQFGIVGLSATVDGEVDGNLRHGFIRRFKEKPRPEEAFSNVINAGLYILEPDVFDHVPPGEKFDFSKQLFPKLLEMGWPLYASTIDGVWFDVGQPSELLRAQHVLLEQRERLPFHVGSSFVVTGTTMVSSSAEVAGEAMKSVIGPRCQVEVNARVESSLLMSDVHVEDGATVTDSVLGAGVRVSSRCVLKDCVVGDGEELLPGGVYIEKRIP